MCDRNIHRTDNSLRNNKRLNFLIFISLFVLLPRTSLAEFSTASSFPPLEARISRINKEGSLIRFRIRDENIKFFNKSEKAKFWNPDRIDRKCTATIVGKSDEYLLVKVIEMDGCLRNAPITVGALVHIGGDTYQRNVQMAADLMDILTKKHQAIKGKLSLEQKGLDGFIEQFTALNDRYEVLMGKLQGEWQQKLGDIEEDRISSLGRYKKLEIELSEIEHKMKQYQIKDKLQAKDGWMLESRLYNYKSADIKRSEF